MLADRVENQAETDAHEPFQPLLGGLHIAATRFEIFEPDIFKTSYHRNSFGNQSQSLVCALTLTTEATQAGFPSTALFVRSNPTMF